MSSGSRPVKHGRWVVQTNLPPCLGARWATAGKVLADGTAVPRGGAWTLNGQLVSREQGATTPTVSNPATPALSSSSSSLVPLQATTGVGVWPLASAPTRTEICDVEWRRVALNLVGLAESRRQAVLTLQRAPELSWEKRVVTKPTPGSAGCACRNRRGSYYCYKGCSIAFTVVCSATRQLLSSASGRQVILWACGGSFVVQKLLYLWTAVFPEEDN